MKSLVIGGIEKDYVPISNAFKIDIINRELDFKFNILQITNIKLNINSSYIESFKSTNSNYLNVLIDISIRVDYICEDKTVKYQIFKENMISCVCTREYNISKNASIETGILDAGIFDISSNKIYIYTLFCCSIDI